MQLIPDMNILSSLVACAHMYPDIPWHSLIILTQPIPAKSCRWMPYIFPTECGEAQREFIYEHMSIPLLVCPAWRRLFHKHANTGNYGQDDLQQRHLRMTITTCSCSSNLKHLYRMAGHAKTSMGWALNECITSTYAHKRIMGINRYWQVLAGLYVNECFVHNGPHICSCYTCLFYRKKQSTTTQICKIRAFYRSAKRKHGKSKNVFIRTRVCLNFG